MAARFPGGRPAAASACAAALALAGAARADDAQQFDFAKARFDAGQFDEAVQRFDAMLDPAAPPCGSGPTDPGARCRITDPPLIERARGLSAAALVALQRFEEADKHIAQILLANPSYVPNPAVFPPEVVDRFTVVRARIRADIEAAAKRKADEERAARLAAEKQRQEERRWITEIRALAGEERITETRSRWIAMIPFGVGQFQNGDTTAGWLFLISEALAGTTSIVSAAILSSYEGVDVTNRSVQPVGVPNAEPIGIGVDIDELNAQIATATAVNRIAFGAWATLAVAGILHAQVTFVPVRTVTRPRAVPPPPPSIEAVPTAAALPGGAFLGVAGRF